MVNAVLTKLKSKLIEKRPEIEEKYPRFSVFAKKTIKSSKRLKQPAFYLGIPLWPLRILMRLNLHLFWSIYWLSGKIKGCYRSPLSFSAEEERKIQKAVNDLNAYGIAKWEAMFTPEQMAEANATMDKLMERSRQFQAKAKPGVDGSMDDLYPGWEHTWELVEKEYEPYANGNPSWIYGRTRSKTTTPPPSLDVFLRNRAIAEVADRYFGKKTKGERILLEELTPSLLSDAWHVDCMGKCVKAMVLSTDCSMNNGPLRYKIASHNSSAPAKKRTFYNMLRYGYAYSYVTLLEYRSLREENFYGTGRAGDCIFFDTTGVHSGSRCIEGNRRAIVLSRDARTFQNVLMDSLGAVVSG